MVPPRFAAPLPEVLQGRRYVSLAVQIPTASEEPQEPWMDKRRKKRIHLLKHKKTKHQQREFDRPSVPLKHVPERLLSMRVMCPTCSTKFMPDWLGKQELPITPVKPKFHSPGVPYEGPGRWVPSSISQVCPKCKSLVRINLPAHQMTTQGFLFGDDAARQHENKKVYVYSLVGADQSLLPALERDVREAKQVLCPSIDTDDWKIHMKDIWSGDNRKRHKQFNGLTFDDVKDFTEKILSIVKQNSYFVYNIAASAVPREHGKKPKQSPLQTEAYLLLVMAAIDEWTEKKAQPLIVFDSEKDSKANQTIHGWARDTFRGSQHSLLYGHLSKGIEIPEPQFVHPGKYPGLELADFVSFVIARYYHRRWQGKPIEIDPADMGLVTYLGYDTRGNFLWRTQEGYPWDQFRH